MISVTEKEISNNEKQKPKIEKKGKEKKNLEN
jgi:hypothetical protein